jgi:hypothetical protein
MSKTSPSRGTEDVEGFDRTMPWGVYIPPSSIGHDDERDIAARTALVDDGGDDDAAIPGDDGRHHRHHRRGGGYVRIADAKGKFFPCGFSRPVGHVMEVAAAAVGRKRGRRGEAGDAKEAGAGDARGGDDDPEPESGAAEHHRRKRTIAEERLHPEEALFLHLRGLLRIVSNEIGGGESPWAGERKDANRTLTTRDLFCDVLPECDIPLAAYLAYAHLREQGYILIRYAERRMRLLLCMMNNGSERPPDHSLTSEGGTPQTNDPILPPADVKGTTSEEEKSAAISERRQIDIDREIASQSDDKRRSDDATFATSSEGWFKSRALRSQLSDDVATAPPPCVISLDNRANDGCTKRPGGEIRLAYYAYNPNARFRRSNPGLPDFGVAVMPYNDDIHRRPTFDVLSSLVSMCEGEGAIEDIGDVKGSGIPLRVVTVADGGAVVAFGVTKGEVPSINRPKDGD